LQSKLHHALDLLRCLSPEAFNVEDLRGNSVNNPQNLLTLSPEHRLAFDTLREWLHASQGEEAQYIVESMDFQQVVSPQVTLAPPRQYGTTTIPAVSPSYLAFHAMLARAYQASGVGMAFEFKELESTRDMEWLLKTVTNHSESKLGFRKSFLTLRKKAQ
jgi:hypothetical protein